MAVKVDGILGHCQCFDVVSWKTACYVDDCVKCFHILLA